MKRKSILAVFASALLMSYVAQAGIIGNGPPNQSGGSDLNAFLEADDFTIVNPTGSEVTQIKFWALQTSPSDFAGTVYWGFYSNLGGFPDTSVASGISSATATSTGNTTFGLDEYSYVLDVSAILLPGSYWLVLHNGPATTPPQTTFYWAWSNGDAGNSASAELVPLPPDRLGLNDPNHGQWAGNSAELAFELTANDGVPEPVSMSLVGGGLLAAWLVSRKAKGLKG